MNGDWVRVKDQLPQTNGPVLVFVPSADPKKPFILLVWYDPDLNTKFQCLKWRNVPVALSEAITHWMPLPEPPETDHERLIREVKEAERQLA